ncbi:hypothetical protein NUKP104_49180 [Klebsiella variicola]|nr:hypothetical protein L473_01492 [Klebsiella pneumoniae BIDMC 36]GKO35586.1 hypothetical protein NUKP104_49180 [Klebsiella variicola]VEC99291.1 Uncharacterised protein [Klebsiella variicola]
MLDQDDKGHDKLNEIYHKVISMLERVKSVKAFSEALKSLIGLERQAYDIDVRNKQTNRDILAHNKAVQANCP